MADIILFHFGQNEVRYVGDGVNHKWVAQDVCNALGVGNTSDALSRLDDDEKDDIVLTDSIGREQKMLTINEPGLYSLILKSRKPIAKQFKRWVLHDVLPTIRETGIYSLSENKNNLERQYQPTPTQKELKGGHHENPAGLATPSSLFRAGWKTHTSGFNRLFVMRVFDIPFNCISRNISCG
jgi:prophage antirepressor-like protein